MSRNGKCADIHVYSGVENVAEQKPISYIMECLSHKWIWSVSRNHSLVFYSSFVTFLTDKNGARFWIGANDIDKENNWVWESDESKVVFSDWDGGGPNNDLNEDCGEIRLGLSLYKWNDAQCYNDKLYICEK